MIDKQRIKTIHADIQSALEAVAAKHNLKASGSRISYQADNFKLTVEFGDRAELGNTDPKLVKDFRKNAWKHGLDGKLNAKFTYPLKGKNVELEVVGMRGKAVIVRDGVGGGLYRFDPHVVGLKLGVVVPKVVDPFNLLPAANR